MAQEALRPLPIGLSEWRDLRTQNMFLVDKTKLLLRLIKGSPNKLFLARPPHMGKTTLVSMLEDLFANGERNFAGTALYGHWTEPTYPVIRLDFKDITGDPYAYGSEPSAYAYAESLRESLRHALVAAFCHAGCPEAQEFERAACALWDGQQPSQFSIFDYFSKELAQIAAQQRLVILIDNWDYPLTQHLGNSALLRATLKVLATFYRWLQTLKNPRFILVTGVLGYREASTIISPDTQNISKRPYWADLLGVTPEELTTSYAPYLERAAQRLQCSKDELLAQLQRHYGGLCCDQDAKVQLYSPSSLNRFFAPLLAPTASAAVPQLRCLRQDDASPYSLHRLLSCCQVDLQRLQTLRAGADLTLSAHELKEIREFSQELMMPLLAETGYLSFKEAFLKKHTLSNGFSWQELSLRCGLPNQEMATAFNAEVAAYLCDQLNVPALSANEARLKTALRQAIAQGDIAQSCARLNDLLYGIAYNAFTYFSRDHYLLALELWLRAIFPEIGDQATDSQRSAPLVVKTEQGQSIAFEVTLVDCLRYAHIDPHGAIALDFQQLDERFLLPAQQQMLSAEIAYEIAVTGIALLIDSRLHQILAWRSTTQAAESCTVVPISDLRCHFELKDDKIEIVAATGVGKESSAERCTRTEG